MRSDDQDQPVNRRRFFREGLRELLKPLAAAIEPIEEAARQLGQLEESFDHARLPAPKPRSIPLNLPLRPPGALDEQRFRETCSRGGECVRVCPAQCIKIDPAGVIGGGAPYIDADVMPCVLCESLACMQVCPSGALVPTVLREIDMGTAVWHTDTCLRTRSASSGQAASEGDPSAGSGQDPSAGSGQDPSIDSGRDCTICVDRCPIGSFAIELIDGRIEVKEAGCTGCGVCQNDCPTSPKSIVVVPKSLRR